MLRTSLGSVIDLQGELSSVTSPPSLPLLPSPGSALKNQGKLLSPSWFSGRIQIPHMGQGPLVLKAAQSLGPVQILGKTQLGHVPALVGKRVGGKEELSLFSRQGN